MKPCERLAWVLERIERACGRSGRDPKEVTLLGATKGVPPSTIEEFIACGLKVFGENRAQEFLKKYEAIHDPGIEWHFIGKLQTNKVKYILGKVSLIHSLDRESLTDEIDKRAGRYSLCQNVLIEVNVGGESTKGGVRPENLKRLYEYALTKQNLRVVGLMAIPPYREDPEEVRPYFAKLRAFKESLEEEFGAELTHLSMGMSSDFEVAVEEGATIVRVGTLLFGERG